MVSYFMEVVCLQDVNKLLKVMKLIMFFYLLDGLNKEIGLSKILGGNHGAKWDMLLSVVTETVESISLWML